MSAPVDVLAVREMTDSALLAEYNRPASDAGTYKVRLKRARRADAVRVEAERRGLVEPLHVRLARVQGGAA